MINWNVLAQAPNPGQAFMDSFNQARQMKQREELMRQQQQEHREDRQLRRDTLQAQQQRALLEQHKDKILIGAKIVRELGVKDEASWQQARTIAQQMGIDLSDIPLNYDPRYVQGLIATADALDPPKQGQLVPFTQGGGVARMGPGGLEILVMPNDGSQPTGAPVNAPPVLTDEDILRMEQGGQSPSGSGGFL